MMKKRVRQMKFDYLIVGAGLYGATFAYEAGKRGKECIVIDKRDHIAGNIYCKEEEGILIHRYGAHIFHTSDEEVWKYVNQFVSFNNFVNSPVAVYKNELYNLPFNMNTFSKMWGIRSGAASARNFRHSSSDAYLCALFMTTIISGTSIRAFRLAATTLLSRKCWKAR